MIKERIKKDFLEAFRNKETEKVSVLRLLQGAIKNKEIENNRTELDEEGVVSVVVSESKKRKDAVEQYKKGGRIDLAEKEEREFKILSVYLPEQLNEEEVRKIIKNVIAETGAAGLSELGKVMSAAMPKLKGRADGNLVNKIVKEELE